MWCAVNASRRQTKTEHRLNHSKQSKSSESEKLKLYSPTLYLSPLRSFLLSTHCPSVSCAHPKTTLLSLAAAIRSVERTRKSPRTKQTSSFGGLCSHYVQRWFFFPNLLYLVADNQVQRALAKWRTAHAERAQQNKSDTRAKIEAISVYRRSVTIWMPTYCLIFTSREREREKQRNANTEIEG